VEVPDSPVADEDSPSAEVGASEDSSPKSDANTGSTKAKRSRPGRKSEMPPVKNEDLVPGAAFTGKVKSIQPFGAFVDFGAFTDGLVHISMLSDSYVMDVASVVSVGQEVKVKVIGVNAETKSISLSMRENADTGKRNDAPNNPEKSGSGRMVQRKIIGRFIDRFLNNCCHLPMMKAAKKEAIEEGITEAVAQILVSEEDLDATRNVDTIQTDIATSNVETDSPVEVADESVIESGEEAFVAATETDSDAVEPGPVVTKSDITSSAPAPQE